jgi:hypothetical protein
MNAQWKIDEGRTVDLRLAGDGFERVHPFKRFQKKRAGRVGTRFHMTCADTQTGELIFNGEVMLAGWNDTSFQGQTIKLWIDEESTRHPFAGYIRRSGKAVGSIFQSVLVEVSEDDTPVDQHAEKNLEDAHARKKKAFSSSAHLMVTSAKFVQYVRETQNCTGTVDPEYAKKWVKWRVGIESLSDLDRDPMALKRFREVIQRPFARWNGEDY